LIGSARARDRSLAIASAIVKARGARRIISRAYGQL
jgi:hypothetical protein